MDMTNEEIVRHYRQAKVKEDDIQVLADLNVTTRDSIISILTEAGEEVKLPKDREREYPLKFDRVHAKELYDMGLDDRSIAKRLGIARSTVYKWRTKNNLPIHRKIPEKKEVRKVDKPKCADSTTAKNQDVSVTDLAMLRIQKILNTWEADDGPEITDAYAKLSSQILEQAIKSRPQVCRPKSGNGN